MPTWPAVSVAESPGTTCPLSGTTGAPWVYQEQADKFSFPVTFLIRLLEYRSGSGADAARTLSNHLRMSLGWHRLICSWSSAVPWRGITVRFENSFSSEVSRSSPGWGWSGPWLFIERLWWAVSPPKWRPQCFAQHMGGPLTLCWVDHKLNSSG